jgi:hypothetical protein
MRPSFRFLRPCGNGSSFWANSAHRIHLSAIRLHTFLFTGSRENSAMLSHSAACRINSSEGTIAQLREYRLHRREPPRRAQRPAFELLDAVLEIGTRRGASSTRWPSGNSTWRCINIQAFILPWLSMTYFEPIGRCAGNRIGLGIGTLLRFRGRVASQRGAFASVRPSVPLMPTIHWMHDVYRRFVSLAQ